MTLAREALPVEKLTCFAFAGLVALLLLWGMMNPPPEQPAPDELIPRLKSVEPIQRPRALYGAPLARAVHFADPFVPDVAGFRRSRFYDRNLVPEKKDGAGANKKSEPVVKRPPPPPPGAKVTLPPFPSKEASKDASAANETANAAAAAPAAPKGPALPGPVSGILRRADGTYRALIRPEGWSDGVASLAAGDEWRYQGEHFRIVDISPTKVTVRDAEGRVKSFVVDGGVAKQVESNTPRQDAETLQLLDQLLRTKPGSQSQ